MSYKPMTHTQRGEITTSIARIFTEANPGHRFVVPPEGSEAAKCGLKFFRPIDQVDSRQ